MLSADAMQSVMLMEALIDLARDAGLEVRGASDRRDSDSRDGEPALASSTCRVRGAVWVVLSSADPLDVRIDVLAGAIREHAAWITETRFVPPAVRERLMPGDFR